jgi:uncharacterized protein
MPPQVDHVSAGLERIAGKQPTRHCVVTYATRSAQHLWTVQLPLHATVGDAIEAARRRACSDAGSGNPEVPWETAPVGIFGELCSRADPVLPGDRIELYRPLTHDPRERRRARLERARKARVSRPRASGSG